MEDNVLTYEKYLKSIFYKMEQKVKKSRDEMNENDYFSRISKFSQIELEYRVTTFSRVLELEDYVENLDMAYSFSKFICADVLERLAEPLLEKRLDERIEFINKNITDFRITKYDIVGNELSVKYAESEYILLKMTYEKASPFILFEDFISFYNISFCVGDHVHLFKYRFPKDIFIEYPCNEEEKWFYADTFQEIICHFSDKLLDKVVNDIMLDMSLTPKPIQFSFHDYIDMNYLRLCDSPKAVYDYLKGIDLARLNLPLHYLYLLLEFENMKILIDNEVMLRIATSLKNERINEEKGHNYQTLRNILNNCTL